MPRAAPVTIATFPCRDMAIILLFRCVQPASEKTSSSQFLANNVKRPACVVAMFVTQAVSPDLDDMEDDTLCQRGKSSSSTQELSWKCGDQREAAGRRVRGNSDLNQLMASLVQKEYPSHIVGDASLTGLLPEERDMRGNEIRTAACPESTFSEVYKTSPLLFSRLRLLLLLQILLFLFNKS